jgi:hypothetical protein
MLSALSILSHGSGMLFLLPVATWFLVRGLAKNLVASVSGAVAGAGLLASWLVYQLLVLPSHDPLTKYALTGDFGFADPSKGLWGMLAAKYGNINLPQWLEFKLRILASPLIPVTNTSWIELNHDFGADIFGVLRGWDFFLLSAGNAGILVAAAAVLTSAVRRRRTAGQDGCVDTTGTTARLLVMLGVATWAVLAVIFVPPIVLHLWPYAALLAVSGGSFGWAAVNAPRLFRIVAVLTSLYAGVVWLVTPIREARSVDAVALVTFTLIAGWLCRKVLGPEQT